ncbi:hypothetical protein M404DRAFT_994755 [Pisolithus tinctorius Marx 270]|uniref:Aminoglycoside phosphotransferase domain-containing protein n=1 Tax=Pisolithus tinctorius Marx 270 TaxID=870435 RepID=A0A0C3KNA9_PISTI|nr:hypothetical protein M404DRAFT_994755 [Pisolithus tinctorius Marx 270]
MSLCENMFNPLLNHEAEFREEMSECHASLTPEEAFELVKKARDDFMAQPYGCNYPFVLRHGDLHGRNVMVRYVPLLSGVFQMEIIPPLSRSSPRRILAILDWDFGGSNALPLADRNFEVSHPDSSEKTDVWIQQAEEISCAQLQLAQLVGALPIDTQLIRLVWCSSLQDLSKAARKARGADAIARPCADSAE